MSATDTGDQSVIRGSGSRIRRNYERGWVAGIAGHPGEDPHNDPIISGPPVNCTALRDDAQPV